MELIPKQINEGNDGGAGHKMIKNPTLKREK